MPRGSATYGPRPARRALTGGLRQVAVVALLPLWPFVAYPLSLSVPPPHRTGRARAVHSMVRHPVVQALAAPMRFVAVRLRDRRARSGGTGGGGWGPPSAGDREPRRPRPNPPTDIVALIEPQR